MLKKLQNVYLPIDKFQAKVFKNSDLSKRGEWVSNFALSLAGESNDDFAEELLTEAQVSFYKEKVRKWKHYIKNVLFNENEGVIPTEKEIYTRCCEEYGDEFVEAVELLESNLKKNKKTRKNPQEFIGEINDVLTATGNDQVPADAATREGAEVSYSAGNGVISEPTNVCKNAEECGTRKDPLNMAHVRKNGTLESGTSSANLQGSARPQKTGAGASAPLLISPLENRAPSPTIANRSDKKQPVNIGAAAPVPPLGSLDCHNREPQAPSPGASHISGDVMSLAYSGEFGNVRLTQEQYAQLGIKFGNQQKLNRAIDSLSCQIENGEKNPQNHYAELVKWASYRDDMEEKEELRASSAPHYETVSEHNARIVRESDAWIHEYCQQQKKNRKAANG